MPRSVSIVTALMVVGLASTVPSVRLPPPGVIAVPGARQRLQLRKALLQQKLDLAVLPAMREAGVDLWITLDRENHPDPLHDELGGASSGALAAFVFADMGEAGLQKIFIGSAQPADSPVARGYDVKEFGAASIEDVKRTLARVVGQRDWRRIALNTSLFTGTADGLTSTLRSVLNEALGPRLAERVVTADPLIHAFRANRTPLETEWYSRLQEWTARLQEEALAGARPGDTSALDLACAFEDAATGLGLSLSPDHGRYPLIVWFGDRNNMPGVTPFGDERALRRGATDLRDFPLQPGDLVTLDGGLRFLTFASDMKRGAYVTRPGESGLPASLEDAWRTTRAVADRFARLLVPGARGEQVFADLLAASEALGLEPAGGRPRASGRPQLSVYGHAVGTVVHDIGPRVAAAGEATLRLHDGEWVSVEFHVVTPSSDAPRGAWITRFEQTARVAATGAKFLIPPQERLIAIKLGGTPQ